MRRQTRGQFNSDQKQARDGRSQGLRIGSWVRFSDHAAVQHVGKIGQIVDWNDDGWNKQRAPRNKRVKIAVEPHRFVNPEIYCDTLQRLLPLSEMEVLAESARDVGPLPLVILTDGAHAGRIARLLYKRDLDLDCLITTDIHDEQGINRRAHLWCKNVDYRPANEMEVLAAMTQ